MLVQYVQARPVYTPWYIDTSNTHVLTKGQKQCWQNVNMDCKKFMAKSTAVPRDEAANTLLQDIVNAYCLQQKNVGICQLKLLAAGKLSQHVSTVLLPSCLWALALLQ